ncbi:inositol polyphosphate 5-phosphatase [Coelomomyces lativittatus]|nr:inositol polyphosphate 5-phosphatase [Coelomomyces lativittatus]KAJ1513592.1 inositol polyphosphate 5-phosphatase [Coelomomyces lativittatus]
MRMGIDHVPEEIHQWHALAWTQTGNAISQCYTGTDAMKTDYTMNKKGVLQGAANDAKKSVTRYLKNQFQDHLGQLLIDALLGYHPWFPTHHPYVSSPMPPSTSTPSKSMMIYGSSFMRKPLSTPFASFPTMWFIFQNDTCTCWVPQWTPSVRWQLPYHEILHVHVTETFLLRCSTVHFGFQCHVMTCYGDPWPLEYPPFRAVLILNQIITTTGSSEKKYVEQEPLKDEGKEILSKGSGGDPIKQSDER